MKELYVSHNYFTQFSTTKRRLTDKDVIELGIGSHDKPEYLPAFDFGYNAQGELEFFRIFYVKYELEEFAQKLRINPITGRFHIPVFNLADVTILEIIEYMIAHDDEIHKMRLDSHSTYFESLTAVRNNLRTMYLFIGYVTQFMTKPSYLDNNKRQGMIEYEIFDDIPVYIAGCTFEGKLVYLEFLASKREVTDFRDGLKNIDLPEKYNVPNMGWKNVSILDCLNLILDNWENNKMFMW